MVQRAIGIIRKDLAGIMLPASPQATTTRFAGQLQSDSFITTALDSTSERITPDITTTSGRIDGWNPFADVQTVAYYLSPAADGGLSKDLMRVVTRNLLPATTDVTTDDQTLLTGVTSAAIAFYDGEYWADTWDSAASSSLPVAIKLSLVLAPREGGNRSDPAPVELVVPVLVKTSTTLQQEAAAALIP
jgi:hypothetical protein